MSAKNKLIAPLILFIFTLAVNAVFSYVFMKDPAEKISGYMQLYKERGPKSHVISDEVGYEVIAGNILKGKGFSLPDASGAPKPTMVREPVYPWFLALVYLIFGHSFTAVFMVQKVLLAMMVVVVYFAVSSALSAGYRYKVGFLAALLTALNADFHYYTNQLMSEILFSFIFMLMALVFVNAVRRDNILDYALSGALLGVCILTKTVMLPFVVIGSFLIMYFTKRMFSSQLLMFVCLCLAVVLPWVARNYTLFKYPSVTTRSGMALWLRAKKLDYKNFDDLNKRAVYTFSREVGMRVYPGYTQDYNYILGKETIEHKQRFGNMRNFLSDEEVDKVCFKEAKEKIKRHPLKYIILTPYEIANLNSFCLNPVVDSQKARFAYKIIFFVSIPLFIIGLFFIRKEGLLLIPAVFILYFNLAHSLFSVDRAGMRYILPVVPFYTLFVIMALTPVLKITGIFKDRKEAA